VTGISTNPSSSSKWDYLEEQESKREATFRHLVYRTTTSPCPYQGFLFEEGNEEEGLVL